MSNLKSTNEANFEKDVLQSKTPVLVDFWAEWCGPCKAILPVLEEISNEVKDKAQIIKVNVDENSGLAQKFGIRGIPTMIFFKGGQAQKTIVGSQPKGEILRSLQELMK